MPQIGEIERGVWLASGFGGHGLNTSAMGGELVARGIVEADQTWRQFAPYELVWAGGVPGRVIAQGLYWGKRPVERLEQGLARYRERARARKQARLAAKNGSGHIEAASVSPGIGEAEPAAAAPASEDGAALPSTAAVSATLQVEESRPAHRRGKGKRRRRKQPTAPPA
jgi:2Fe-2S ferredoxin